MSLEKYFRKDVEMATSWDDVTLEQFEKLNNIKADDVLRQAEIVSILSGISVDDLMQMDADDYIALCNKTNFLKDAPRKCIPEPVLKVGDITYNVTLSAQQMNAGQFLDYKTIVFNDAIDRKLARLMLCFMVPVDHTYNDGYDVETHLNNLEKNMSVVEVTAYSNFFMLQYQAYSVAMLEYSMRQIKKDKKMKKDKKEFLLNRLNEVKATIKNGGCLL